MSWKSGSGIASELVDTVEDLVANFNTRKEIYKRLIEVFEDHDCDTLYELVDDSAAFKDAYYEIHPGYLDEDDYEVDED